MQFIGTLLVKFVGVLGRCDVSREMETSNDAGPKID